MKYIKWFIVSSFLILFLGFCQIVNAESFVQVYATENYITGTWQNGYTYKSVTGSADNLLVPALDSWSVNNLDLTNVDADVIQFNFIAGYYQQQNYTSVTNWENITIHASYNSRTVVPCTISGTGQFIVKCPIPKNDRILTRISFSLMGAFPWRIGIHQYINAMKSDTKEIIESQNSGNDETNNQLQDMNDNMTSTDISGASQDQNNLINNPAFQDNTGLSGIITAPLSMISSLTNQCQPIQLTLPYLKDTNVSIPCMGNFLQSKVPALVTLIKVFVNGFICYLIGLDLFKIVKNARDPDNDRIEVLDL